MQIALPIFPKIGTRVRIPDPDSSVGGDMLAFTMTEAREVGGQLKIKCVGAGWVPAGRVKRHD